MYTVGIHVVAPSGAVVKLANRKAQDLLRSGHVVEARGGVPTLVPLAGAVPVIERNGVQYVRNPVLRTNGRPSNRLVRVGSPTYKKILAAGYELHAAPAADYELHAAPAAGPADAPAGYLRLRENLPQLALTGHGTWPAFRAALADFLAAHPAGRYSLRVGGRVFDLGRRDGQAVSTTAIFDALSRALALGSDLVSREELIAAITGAAADDGGDGVAARMAGAVLFPTAGQAVDERVAELYAANADGYCVRSALAEWDPAADWSWVPDCCDGTDMANIVERARMTIRVWSAARDREPVFTYQPGKTANRGRICDLWHQNHHVQLIAKTKARSLHAHLFPHDTPVVVVRAGRRRVTRAVPVYSAADEARLLAELPEMAGQPLDHLAGMLAQLDGATVPVPVGEELREFDADLTAAEVLDELFRELGDREPVLPVVLGADAELVGFRTATHTYKAADRANHKSIEHCPREWTDCGAALAVFYQAKGRPHLAARFAEMRAGAMVNKAIMYHAGPGDKYGYAPADGHEYDLRAAYRSSHTFPGYTGVPDPAAPRDWVKWDPAFADPATPVEGLALVHSAGTFPVDTVFECRTMMAPLPLVREALRRGERLEISGVFLSRRYAGDVFEDVKREMARIGGASLEKAATSALVGRFWSSEVTETRVATSLAECRELVAGGYTLIRTQARGDNCYYFLRGEPTRVERLYPDLVQYIHAYTKLMVIVDVIARLPEAGMGWGDVVRWWCDGITLRRPLPEGFLDAGRWAHKFHPPGSRSFPVTPIDTAAPPIAAPEPADYLPEALLPRVALLGPPGSGKSHAIRHTWAPARRLRLTGTTRCAAAALRGVPGEPPTTTQKVLAAAAGLGDAYRELRGFDRLVVDEFTMLTLAQLDALEALDMPLLLSGDFAQLAAVCPPGSGDAPITRAALEARGYHIVDLGDANRRAADAETAALYAALRPLTDAVAMADAAVAAGVRTAPAAAVAYPAAGERAHLVAAHNETVRRHNLEYCRRLAPAGAPTVAFGAESKKRKAETVLEAPFTPGMLLIGVRSDTKTGAIDNQEIVTAVEYVKAQGRRKEAIRFRRADGSEASAPPAYLTPAFAITFHRLQGQTLDCPLAVDLAGIFEAPMLYVAVTRVRRLAQLTLLGHVV